MNYAQVIIFSSSIFIAAIIALIKFKNVSSAFYPFIICIWLASANEIISFVVTALHFTTAVNNNIYVLAEALLIVWQFKSWGVFSNKKIYHVIAGFLLFIWLLENFAFSKSLNISVYFRIIYSFLIVLMSIHINNKLIFNSKEGLLKNPIFLLCTGFIIYFTYKILVEVFWMYGLSASSNFRNSVYIFLVWINLFVNIIYSVAVLCIPKKPFYLRQ